MDSNAIDIELGKTECVNIANSVVFYVERHAPSSKLEACEIVNMDRIRRVLVAHMNVQTVDHTDEPIRMPVDEAGCTAIVKAVYYYWKKFQNLYVPNIDSFHEDEQLPARKLCNQLRSATLNVMDKTTSAYLSVCPKQSKAKAFRSLYYEPIVNKLKANPV